MDNLLSYAITAILGGGLFTGISALYRAIVESKEKKNLAKASGAKTPLEIESLSVATMTKALESAQNRISALEEERKSDRDYYQDRIRELTLQLQRVRDELTSMEVKVAELIAETHPAIRRKEGL